MVSRVVVIGVATQACLCLQRRIPPPSRTSSSSSSADGGLRLVLSPAPRCRHRHCGHMGVATHVSGAPVHVSSSSSSGAHDGAARVTPAAASSSSCRDRGTRVLRLALVEGAPCHRIVVVIGGARWLRLAFPLPPAASCYHRR